MLKEGCSSARHDPRASRDRWLAFAFAAADLLVEATLDGVIRFAAGTFRQRLGAEPESFIGQPVGRLFALADQAGVAVTLGMTSLHGRTPPVVLHLRDAAGTPCAVAAMLLPDHEDRVCLTIGPVAAPTPTPPRLQAEQIHQAGGFAREAEAWLRGGAQGMIGLLEVPNWDASVARLGPAEAHELQTNISQSLSEGAEGALVGELASGCFGVLAADSIDLATLGRQLEALLRGAGAESTVRRLELPLGDNTVGRVEAVRALRYALDRFGEGGTEALLAAGGGDGLGGIVHTACKQARAMRAALAARRFSLAFQPVVTLLGRTVQHFEALLRPKQVPGVAADTPQSFVTFAEAIGLAEELDSAVLAEAIDTLRGAPGVKVAVNLSGLSIQNPAFGQRLLQTVRAAPDLTQGVDGGRLLLEVTETAEITDIAHARETMEELRALGVSICIDDFGAGNAAFRYLRDFRVDYVKIDGSYVQGAMRDPRECRFVSSMAELARSGGARVVAEMIETEEQAQLMRDIGIELGQGWLFGRPGRLPGLRR